MSTFASFLVLNSHGGLSKMTEEQASDEVLGQEEVEEVELADEALTEYENNMTAAIEAAFDEDYGTEEETEMA